MGATPGLEASREDPGILRPLSRARGASIVIPRARARRAPVRVTCVTCEYALTGYAAAPGPVGRAQIAALTRRASIRETRRANGGRATSTNDSAMEGSYLGRGTRARAPATRVTCDARSGSAISYAREARWPGAGAWRAQGRARGRRRAPPTSGWRRRSPSAVRSRAPEQSARNTGCPRDRPCRRDHAARGPRGAAPATAQTPAGQTRGYRCLPWHDGSRVAPRRRAPAGRTRGRHREARTPCRRSRHRPTRTQQTAATPRRLAA
jgi:hypothetical protein